MSSQIDPSARYQKTHEWARLEGDEVLVGISDHAQDALSDLVFVDLPGVGAKLAKGDRFGTVESVKAASDVYVPVAGTITAVNSELEKTPETINKDPYHAGWLIRIKPDDANDLDGLLSADAYEEYLQKEEEKVKDWVVRNSPGILFSGLIAIIAVILQALEVQVLGQPIIEGLVIAILLGMLVRTFLKLDARLIPGIGFSGKQILEFAIVLLGVSIDLPSLLKAGPAMLLSIIMVVMIGIFASTQIGRLLGLNPKLAILVACGNSICGNSAIAAVAPVIGAEKKDIASSIALTAVLGVVVVLTLPLLISVVGLSLYQYGVLAGMTVYAVPQVIAATYSVSTISGDIGTLVKLVRVLMLGPVVLFFALRFRNTAGADRQPVHTAHFTLDRFIPWFIIGFVILAIARSVALIPVVVADPLREVSRDLTVVAMAALGLGVDIRALRQVGRPVALAVIGSLLVLITLALILIKVFGIAGA